MSKAFRAVDDIKKLSKYLQGLMEFGAELESLGSLEQAKNELEVAVSQLGKLKADKVAELDSVSGKVSDAMKALESAEDKAEKIVAEAQNKAAELHLSLKSQGEEYSAKLIKDARDKAKAHEDSIRELMFERSALESQISELKDKRAEAAAHIADLKAKLGV